jgi:hypothetical protein
VTSAVADGLDVIVTWSAVQSAPGGYEVWRTADLQRAPVRVAAVSGKTLTCRDKQAGAGPFYYRVVAIGAGGSRAVSAWLPFNVPGGVTTTTAAASTAVAPQGSTVTTIGTGARTGIAAPLASGAPASSPLTFDGQIQVGGMAYGFRQETFAWS